MSTQDGSAKQPKAVTEFDPTAPPASPSKPDFVSEGKVLDKVSVAAGATVISKSVQTPWRTGQYSANTIHIVSDQPGTYIVQKMVDESERDNLGHAVWRANNSTPLPIAANVLISTPGTGLNKQMRIVFTASVGNPGPATVSAWIFSI